MIEYLSVRKEDIITYSGGEDYDKPVVDDDVNSELPFVPAR